MSHTLSVWSTFFSTRHWSFMENGMLSHVETIPKIKSLCYCLHIKKVKISHCNCIKLLPIPKRERQTDRQTDRGRQTETEGKGELFANTVNKLLNVNFVYKAISSIHRIEDGTSAMIHLATRTNQCSNFTVANDHSRHSCFHSQSHSLSLTHTHLSAHL